MKITREFSPDLLKRNRFRERDRRLVKKIIRDVERGGDKALRFWTRKLDGFDPCQLRAEPDPASRCLLGKELRDAVFFAADNIRKFSRAQKSQFCEFALCPGPGVKLMQKMHPVNRVAVYVPAGRHPLISSLLMGVIPAQEAGVSEIVVVSPPRSEEGVDPRIRQVGALLGVEKFYAMGGAQAIAALAFGTESVARVDKVVGPGNRYVTLAKWELSTRIGVDLVAGPSEVLVVADRHADAVLVAADLLAQAEHDPDALCMLVTDSRDIAGKVRLELKRLVKLLKNGSVAIRSLQRNGQIVILDSLESAAGICEQVAPEHLCLHLHEYMPGFDRLSNFGSMFTSPEACEVYADYCAGLNHTLPTAGTARFSSGLSIRDFLRFPTVLEVSGSTAFIEKVNKSSAIMAEAEGLQAHNLAAKLREKSGRMDCG